MQRLFRKYKNYLILAFALSGWVMYLLEDTLRKIVFDFAKDGLTVERILQLLQFSGVIFIALKAERILWIVRKFKTDIRTETSEKIGGLSSKVHQQNKELKMLHEQSDKQNITQELTYAELRFLKWIFLFVLQYLLYKIEKEEN